MSPQFHLVGAFDRHNYGDILFPIVHTQFLLSHKVPADHIHHVAITEADLQDIGGFQTSRLKDLLSTGSGQARPEDVVVMCGGDILSADWLLMVAHLHSPTYSRIARVVRRVLGVPLTNSLVRRWQGEVNTFPYVVSHRVCPARIFYTAVGGAGFQDTDQLGRVAAELRETDRITVRDLQVQQLLASQGIQADLVPDTALLMSEFFPPEALAERDWTRLLQTSHGFDLQKYFSFQGAKRLLQGHLDALTEELVRTHALTGLAPMFVPIGRASDHEDHVVLEELFKRLSQRGLPCAYLDSLHVLDIMAALAFAKSYIGTSLHGAITTYAFGHKPCALLCGEVKKLQDFLTTWLQAGDYALFAQPVFAQTFSQLLEQGSDLQNTAGLAQHQAMVRSELERYLHATA